MEIKIIEEKHNGLFGRKEVKASLHSAATPSRLQIIESLSKKFSCPAENVKILGIKGRFGTNAFTVSANIYNSKDEMTIVELKKKKEAVTAAPKETATAPA